MMEKQEILRRVAETKEDKLMLASLLDKYEAFRVRGQLAFTPFLDMRQQQLASRVLSMAGCNDPVFYGGPEGFERKLVLFLPDWMDIETLSSSKDNPLSFLRATFDETIGLSHRDFLGSLMGAGIARESVGDIHVKSGICYLAVLKTIKSYLLDNLISAGRAKLAISEVSESDVEVSEPEFRIITDSLASLRLDSLVSAGFLLSREKAAALILSGKVILNYEPCLKPDKDVAEGDVVSSRGFGKFLFYNVKGATRKGRTAIEIKKYI